MSYLRKANIGVDFSLLRGAFVRPTILPHDIDGIVEVNGQFTIIECKQGNEEFSEGQIRSLETLAREPNKLVIEVRLSGKHAKQGAMLFDPVAVRMIQPCRKWGELKRTTLEEFRSYCRDWEAFRSWLGRKNEPQTSETALCHAVWQHENGTLYRCVHPNEHLDSWEHNWERIPY